jgi:hypothetical protein
MTNVAILQHLVSQIRQARGVVLGVSQEGREDNLGQVGQALESLVYEPETGYPWRQIQDDPALVERVITAAERELGITVVAT